MSTLTQNAPLVASGAKNPKKQIYFAKLEHLASTYDQILLVEADNVGSKQMAEIRLALRGRATVLMGKNTMIKTCLRKLVPDRAQIANLIDLIKDNVGMVFCNEDPASVRKTILEFKVPAPAKLGSLAPTDVHIPAGPTGMDPGQTSFFQSLGIATKIIKGQIEIQNNVHIIKVGDRVSASQAVLLTKLNIRPFSYGLKCTNVYDNGSVYPASVLDVSTADLIKSMQSAVQTIAAVSLGASYPTKCSAPHSILNAYRQVVGVALVANYDFPALDAIKAALAKPQTIVNSSGNAGVASAAPPATPDEEADEDDDDMGFGLFD